LKFKQINFVDAFIALAFFLVQLSQLSRCTTYSRHHGVSSENKQRDDCVQTSHGTQQSTAGKDNNRKVVLSWLNIPSQYVRAPTFSSLLCDCFLEHKKGGSSLIASTRRVLQSQQGLRFITLISYCISINVVVLREERQEDTTIIIIDEYLHHSVRYTFLRRHNSLFSISLNHSFLSYGSLRSKSFTRLQ
jgi:hypothetical protein